MKLTNAVILLSILLMAACATPPPPSVSSYAIPSVPEDQREDCEEKDEVRARNVMVVSKYAPPPMGAKMGGIVSRTLLLAPETEFNTESYDHVEGSPFLEVATSPLSTFSIDVDTASYSNVRRLLNGGDLPPTGAVRIEEFVNYFSYNYPEPDSGAPFAVDVEINEAPWNRDHRLVRIGLKGRELPAGERPSSNLVFLIDVSGSMQPADKLPLLRSAMKMLTNTLGANDSVAIVVYAGAAGLVLPATSASNRDAILDAITQLEAGGSTAGGSGIQLAYKTARQNFIRGGVNRVILATDGDFNVGITNQSDLVELIEREASDGVFLTVLGFGTGNYKDSTLEQLADKGNGNYAYIDTRHEARKVLVEEIGSTLVTIAKDVKIQVEFNPALVQAYRLIGYENRVLRDVDFNDDQKDAGEIGAGHTVTALYEVIPTGQAIDGPGVDPLRYQQPAARTDVAESGELFTLKLRFKQPEGDVSELLTFNISDQGFILPAASADFRFAAAVAAFGMVLRESEYIVGFGLADVSALARDGLGPDRSGHRSGFLELVEQAETLQVKIVRR
jgi:Ca-activated chloride channel family protein